MGTLRAIRGNDKIRLFLSNITGGNTRLIVELISGFCGSPNVDSERIVRIEEEKGEYQIPLHEFTKHALLGEYVHYNHLSSLVAFNIFDVGMADPREHFLSALIIGFLNSPSRTRDHDGFINGRSVAEELKSLGFIEDQTWRALRSLAERRLIETPHGHFREIPVPDDQSVDSHYFRATSIGVYHIQYWLGTFAFLDAMSTDTPIFDHNVREDVWKLASSYEIADRLRRAQKFRSYLESRWTEANFTATYFDFPAVCRSQDDTFETVRRHLSGDNSKRRKGSGRRQFPRWSS